MQYIYTVVACLFATGHAAISKFCSDILTACVYHSSYACSYYFDKCKDHSTSLIGEE